MHEKNRDDYIPPIPFPLPQNGYPLFIEYTGSIEADNCPDEWGHGITSSEEVAQQRLARVANVIAINSPPLTAGLSNASTAMTLDAEPPRKTLAKLKLRKRISS
jgi:hypothetical protein